MKTLNDKKGSTIGAAAFAILLASVTMSQPAAARINFNPIGNTGSGGGLFVSPPPPPSEVEPNSPYVRAKWTTPDSVLIRWDDKSRVEHGFRVEQEESKGQWRIVETFEPLYGAFLTQNHEVKGLTPDTGYCFRVVAFNDEGDSEPSSVQQVCTRTTSEGSCSSAKIEEVLQLAHYDKTAERDRSWVKIDCDLRLEPNRMITKRLFFKGSASSGVTVDLNGATLNGGPGSYNEGKDMILVVSREFPEKNMDGSYMEEISTYERPEDITIKNGHVIGSVRLLGMRPYPRHEDKKRPAYQCAIPPRALGSGSMSSSYMVKCEIPNSDQVRKSSRLPGHTARTQMNAPTNIVLDGLKITGTGRNPLYFSMGVTDSKLINSEMDGKSTQVAIYLDAESAGNTIKNNNIHVSTRNSLFERWDRPLIAIDGSRNNKIVNNHFSNLSHGGIYLYRNCGENKIVRHQTPSYNKIINNIFYYNKYQGDNPAVYLGSRDRGGLWDTQLGFCNQDRGYPFGSSESDGDYARYNVVMQNQIYKRFAYDMIKSKNSWQNSPNYVANNETVTEETVDKDRPAGCYVEIEDWGFMSHGETFEVSGSQCRNDTYTCDNGELIKEPVSNRWARFGQPALCASEDSQRLERASPVSAANSPRGSFRLRWNPR